jgi:flagellar P-ring protein precursor FlgI
MRRLIIIAAALALALTLDGLAHAARIKDMASVKGVRGNQLIGYGLVVGLNGSGDKSATTFTVQGLTNMLTRMGVKVTSGQVKVKNVAAVMVTSDLPAFARAGNRVDVTLSSIGDATSLYGGTLVLTPLKGVDGNVYAVAQGPVAVGGFQAGGEAASVTKNHPTVGRIPEGAVVEREVTYDFANERLMTVNLHTPSFTNAVRVAGTINQHLPTMKARAVDPATVQIDLPQGPGADPVTLMAKLESLEITPDKSARVVVDERTGTVVMGEAVRLSTVAVASGALSISITEKPQVSQALPFAPGGQTVVTPQTQVQVGEQKRSLAVMEQGVSIGEVVRALNALGATPREIIVILQAVKSAGALQGELEVI